MQRPELTLAAALRDAKSQRKRYRNEAIRNLAPALLFEQDRPGPQWRAAADHPHGEAVLATLDEALEDDDGMLRGLAAIGLGLLGEPKVIEATAAWIDTPGDDEAAMFQRECALIAMSFVGSCAPQGDRAREDALRRLRPALHAELADVRFQAAVAIVEVGGNDVEAELVDALHQEDHPMVRENLVAALSRLDPPGEEACETLIGIVEDPEEGTETVGFEAAMCLAAARRTEGGPRLVRALYHRGERDRALEALAALGRSAPGDAVELTHRLARAWLTPGVTRVRAAYALARMVAPASDGRPNPGRELLGRLSWHPRPAVREAVADAVGALRKLETDG